MLFNLNRHKNSINLLFTYLILCLEDINIMCKFDHNILITVLSHIFECFYCGK